MMERRELNDGRLMMEDRNWKVERWKVERWKVERWKVERWKVERWKVESDWSGNGGRR